VSEASPVAVREATADDADAVAQLLRDFNHEFGDPAPDPSVLAARIRELLAGGDTGILVAADPQPIGLSVMRFRLSLWIPESECYLAELYVVPARRGHGIGRAVMQASMHYARSRGAGYMDLGTAETDVVARRLYESLGFDNHEGKPDGPVNYCYERDL
jgi:ribosomal protein S18 acetylase RimI-like enzyme